MDLEACPLCFQIISNENRFIVESCGHSKCRNCFLLEEDNCKQCPNQNAITPAKVVQDILIAKPVIDELKSPDFKKPKLKKKTISEHIIKSGDYFECTFCNKKFRSRQQQYYHLNCDKPQESRPFKCNECSRGFLKESHLQYHLSTHSCVKYKCMICKKNFSNTITFNKHSIRHYESSKVRKPVSNFENMYPCNECNKKFLTNSQLKRHSITHRRDKTKFFSCNICNCKFIWESSLKSHLKKHDKPIKFECEICRKIFTEKNALKRHRSMHEDRIFYQCKLCNIKINRKDNLKRHIKSMHPESYSSDTHCIEFSEKIESFIVNIEGESKMNVAMKKNEINENKQIIGKNNELNRNATIELKKENTIQNLNKNVSMKYVECSVIKSIGNARPLSKEDQQEKSKIEEIKEINIPALANKKLKKKYDPAEVYRKILFMTTEEETNENSNLKVCEEIKLSANPKDNLMSSNDDGTCTYSNFSEKHWRKNFYN